MKPISVTVLLFLFVVSYAQGETKEFPYFGLEKANFEESLQYYSRNHELERKRMSYDNLRINLKIGEYQKINNYFELLENARAENKLSINHYYDLFAGPLSGVNLEDIGLFTQWQEKEPDAYYSNLITGKVFVILGGKARGTKWAQETSKHQFMTMAQFFEMSKKYLDKALQINPKGELAYVEKILITRNLQELKTLFEDAKKYVPNSYLIYNQYINKLQPRWYGSHEEMIDFALEAQKTVNQESRMRVLLGQAAADIAFRYKSSKDYENAIKYYDFALYHGAFSVWINNRRDSYYALKQYEKALPDTLLLDKLPNKTAKQLRKTVIVKQKNNLPFKDDIQLLKERDWDGKTAFSLGTFFSVNNIQPETAADLYAFAITKDPRNDIYYQWYLGSLKKFDSEKYAEELNNYIKLCEKIECNAAFLKHSQNMK